MQAKSKKHDQIKAVFFFLLSSKSEHLLHICYLQLNNMLEYIGTLKYVSTPYPSINNLQGIGSERQVCWNNSGI